ncbi:ras guanine nucleotide exchange factor domain-containing protein [Suillus fuscotomentosus]|uniref:Ras guanine nucleotide exchange factor domain-containing protein n=1 Tax=Suillus fuscotomentosus TaxID=1912939 RepID=A0AAD4HRV5_9AGAM|nr:ras guanine nucleotide exchange factor domain-containing protein [Suillus fuscotomentosus]KAG1906703.1 ras guanine nucleotide exchange factor domain-containing protein [Suillus fuscotomentosus]
MGVQSLAIKPDVILKHQLSLIIRVDTCIVSMASTITTNLSKSRTIRRKAAPRLEPEPEVIAHGPRESLTQKSDISTSSDNSAVSSTCILSLNVPQFDIQKTFPAILDPVRLFHEAADAQDIESIRSLTPTFLHGLTTILRSMSQLPEDVRHASGYRNAESGVRHYKLLFMSHIQPLLDNKGFELVCRRQFIWETLGYLDAIMSSLKRLMQVAELEMRQLKPLPDTPEECEEEIEAEEDSDHINGPRRNSLLSGDTHQSSEGSSTDRTCVEEADELGSLAKPLAIKHTKRGLAAILGPLSVNLRRKISQSSAKADKAASVEKLTTCTGHARATANIRNSIALFPELFDDELEKSFPHPDDSTELFLDKNGVLQLASLKGLVRYLTSAVSDDDLELSDVFFLCFRYFSTPALVLEAFIERYKEKLPGCLSPDQAHIQSMHVKMRVARLLNQWVDLHWRHSEDQEVFAPLLQFAFSDLSRDLPRSVSSKLIDTLHNAACAKEHNGRRLEKTVQLIQGSSPAEELCSLWEPRGKKAMVKGEFANIKLSNFASPQGMELLAHQLTALLWEKYRDFQPEDAARFWVEEATGKSTYGVSNDASTKVTTYASFEKALHLWALDVIVSAQSMEDRIQKVQFVLEWAQECHIIGNYAASWALFSACDRQSLVGSLSNIGARHEEILLALRLFFSHTNRMKAYKDAIQSSRGPTLPTLVLFIGDVKRQCGNEECVDHPNAPGHKLINLRRYRPLTRAIRDMERCHTPYCIQRVDYVCQWMEEVVCSYLSRPEVEWEDIFYDKSQRLGKKINRKCSIYS